MDKRCIPFHTDTNAASTLPVALVGDFAYSGGRLVFAVRSGSVFVPARGPDRNRPRGTPPRGGACCGVADGRRALRAVFAAGARR